MANPIKAAAPSNAARNTTPNVVNNNQQPGVSVESMTLDQRLALMEQLRAAQQVDVAPLEKRKGELEAELQEIKQQIQAIKPVSDTLAVYRAVRSAVKAGNKSLDDIAETAGFDQAAVEAMLIKHLTGKDGNDPIFTEKDGGYILTPKNKKS